MVRGCVPVVEGPISVGWLVLALAILVFAAGCRPLRGEWSILYLFSGALGVIWAAAILGARQRLFG